VVTYRLEANHLDTFNFNFRNHNYVVFPKPIHELTSESVLVETFEPGDGISKYLSGIYPEMYRNNTKRSKQFYPKFSRFGYESVFEDDVTRYGKKLRGG
jgi:predicted unusual protein kinase regulating ubiquinone biosynthesis (AarF/ABC1/UbiB family)